MAGFPDRRPRPQALVSFPAAHMPDDAEQGRFNQEVLAVLRTLQANPILRGVYLDLADFELVNNTPKAVPHGLGRTPVGVVLVHHTGDGTTVFYESAAPDDEFVYVVVTDNTFDYTLYVY